MLKTVYIRCLGLSLMSFMLALSLFGCGGGKTYEPDTLRMNLQAEPPSLDWLVTTDSTSFDVISNLMIGLTQYTNSLKCNAGCAQRWEVLDGGRRYLFHLRKDVLWTDGQPVLARDFEYAWKRLLDPKTAAQYAFFLYDLENGFEFNSGKVKDAAQVGVKALDNHTLEVRLRRPAAYFIYLTAFCPTYPQRQDIVEKYGDRWTEPEHIVTNGPFMLTLWRHEYKIELTANPRFIEGPPKLKKIKMFMIPEQATAFGLYENNQLDYVDNRSFPTADVERYRNSPHYTNIPLLRATYLAFNVKKKPFDDVRVRRAFSMAIDRTTFPKILRRGERPAYSWIPPQLAGYSEKSAVHFDPLTARRLLAEAGYPDGKNFPPVKLLYPHREDAKLVVEQAQEQIKRHLNVRVQLEVNEWKVYLETVRRDPPPIFRQSWGADYPDAETFMNLFTTHNGNNDTRWSNALYDSLVERAAGEQDPERRKALYAEADALLCKEEAPIIPTYFATQNLMVKPWVKGMEFNALDVQFFKDVSISPAR
ncbi:MAG TPA: peptide ABC transporter substrate-binding protein [Candidatus Obscuribacterales bacterium]